MKSTLDERIREARQSKGMDQAKLAARLDIATSTLQRWEKGEQVPDSNYLMRIAKHTGVSPHWLLTSEGGMYSRALETSKVALKQGPFPQRIKRDSCAVRGRLHEVQSPGSA